MEHIVYIQSAKRGLGSTPALRSLMKKSIRETLKQENVPFRCEIAVRLTDDEDIREINRENRNVDAATDVLSFPMLDWYDGEGDLPGDADTDPETGAVFLGDMVISVDRVRQQAEEYGHSFDRECAYLTVHSILHLLGYDHVDNEQRKAVMRAHEEKVLTVLGLTRDNA